MDSYKLKFENVSDYEASKYAMELKQILTELSPDIQISQVQENGRAQDVGTILQIIVGILGSGSAIAIAQGVASWLKKRQGASIVFTKNGIKAENITSNDAIKLAEILMNKNN